MSVSDNLKRYLRGVFLIEHKEGPCFRLTLKHTVPKGPAEDVQNYNIGDSQEFTEEFVSQMQSKIENDAFADSEGHGGLQKYALYAYHVNDPNHSQSRLVFRMGDAATDEKDFESEPANERGMVSMLMRHTEALMRSQVMSTNNVLTTLQRENARLQAEKEKMEEHNLAAIRVREELLNQHHERLLVQTEVENNMAMKQDMYQKLMMLAPVAINKMAGQKILPENTSPMAMALRGLAESLTKDPDRLAKIAMSGMFNQAELAAIQELISSAIPDPNNGKDGN